MQADDWQKINSIFQAILALSSDEQSAYLDKECPSHLREEVETLIQYNKKKESILDRRPVEGVRPQNEEDPLIGRSFGHFRISRRIGKGGMGSVYLAVRDAPYKQIAAIKILNKDLNSEENRLRFFRECQILAALDHPNIPKLIGGGDGSDGISYYIMDYVEGWSISEYCDINKLTVDERISLFLNVCSAVEHVHDKNIIHCDVKPSNILISSAGTPKLLDFGIAKFTDPQLSRHAIDPTAPAERRLTLKYASPEQLRGDPLTFASDVYSLGALLYELLTGHYPDREKLEKPSAVVQLEGETLGRGGKKKIITPDSVSSERGVTSEKLSESLKGELDEIILKAVREEVSRRYLEVKDLSKALDDFIKKRSETASNQTPQAVAGSVKSIDQEPLNLRHTLVVAGLLIGLAVFAFAYIGTIQNDYASRGYQIVIYEDIDWDSLIEKAQTSIRGQGINLEMIKPEKIVKRLSKAENLRAEIVLLDPLGDAVLQREKDENHLSKARIMQKFLDFQEHMQRSGLDPEAADRLMLRHYDAYPTMAVILIDDDLYVYFYTYGELGTSSPVIKINKVKQPAYYEFFVKQLDSVDDIAKPLTEDDCNKYKEALKGN